MPLPANNTVSCEPCNPGEIRSLSNAECTPCETGYHRANDESACTACGAGTAAIRETNYEYFYEDIVATKFTRSCVPASECSMDAGWRAMNEFIDTGRGHAAVDMTLTLKLEIFDEQSAGISFTFDTTCLSYYDCVLYFYIDNIEVISVEIGGMKTAVKTGSCGAGVGG